MKLKITPYLLLIFLLASCTKPSITYFVQNTHQGWDTVHVYILQTDDENKIPSLKFELKEGVEELYHCVAPRTNSSTYFAKTIVFQEIPKVSNGRLYEIIVYNDTIVSSGSGGFPNKTTYTIITTKNNGGAYNIKSYTPKARPKELGKWTIIADKPTKEFLSLD